jgi:hypothetical protein
MYALRDELCTANTSVRSRGPRGCPRNKREPDAGGLRGVKSTGTWAPINVKRPIRDHRLLTPVLESVTLQNALRAPGRKLVSLVGALPASGVSTRPIASHLPANSGADQMAQ